MRAGVFHASGDIRVDTVPDPSIVEPSDALVRVTRAAICGSDLWFYRGIAAWKEGWRTGHEFIGVVEAVGADVTGVRAGDHVIAPFAYSDGTCEFCRQGLQTSCLHGGGFGGPDGGGQAELVRVPLADGTLVAIPPALAEDSAWWARVLPLTDVLPTGHHAVVSSGAHAGDTVAVVGDGAVGLCAVMAARRLGAERILAIGHNAKRLELARDFGATETFDSHDADCAERVVEATGGGAPHVAEAVGTQSAMDLALKVARPGGSVGYVGVPRGIDKVDVGRMFSANIGLRGGVAPVRAYLPELLADVVAGKLDPSPVFDLVIGLDQLPAGYGAMDERRAIKVMVEVAG